MNNSFYQILQFVYYIAGICAFSLIFITLKQNKLLKEDINNEFKFNKIAFQREITLGTINQCRHFYDDILPEALQVIALIADNHLFIARNPSEQLLNFNDRSAYYNYKERDSYSDDLLYNHAIELLNTIDIFAMHFTEKICEESIAYKSLCQAYIQVTESLYPFILKYRVEYRSIEYDNLIQLYELWYSRFKNESLEIEKAEFELLIEKKEKEFVRRKFEINEELKPLGID